MSYLRGVGFDSENSDIISYLWPTYKREIIIKIDNNKILLCMCYMFL